MIEPPDWLAEIDLPARAAHPERLWRISRHAVDKPYFGRSGGNRFDDPRRVYGVSYRALSLLGAVSETRAAGKLVQRPGSAPLARARGHGAVFRTLNVVVDDPLARLL